MAKKMALGKGIASLIQDTPNEILRASLNTNELNDTKKTEIPQSGVLMINVETVKPSPSQPRKIFKEKELDELAQSIKENGILQPLIVSKGEDGKFELIAGERRLRAAKKAGLEQVPVIVKRTTTREKKVFALVENIQRADLNCVEEAFAYYQLINEFQITQEEVAKMVGKERSSIANFLRLLKLPREVLDLLQKDELSFGHGKLLVSIGDREKTLLLAKQAVESGMSVRELERLIATPEESDKKPKKELVENEALNLLRQKIEQKTGWHINIKMSEKGKGHISLKFGNKDELETIFEQLMKMDV